MDNSGIHVMFVKARAGVVRSVHVTPSGDVMTPNVSPERLTAANNFNSGDHATEYQSLIAGTLRCVHVIPSGDVMTHLLSPASANGPTATYNPTSAAQHIPYQRFGADVKFG